MSSVISPRIFAMGNMAWSTTEACRTGAELVVVSCGRPKQKPLSGGWLIKGLSFLDPSLWGVPGSIWINMVQFLGVQDDLRATFQWSRKSHKRGRVTKKLSQKVQAEFHLGPGFPRHCTTGTGGWQMLTEIWAWHSRTICQRAHRAWRYSTWRWDSDMTVIQRLLGSSNFRFKGRFPTRNLLSATPMLPPKIGCWETVPTSQENGCLKIAISPVPARHECLVGTAGFSHVHVEHLIPPMGSPYGHSREMIEVMGFNGVAIGRFRMLKRRDDLPSKLDGFFTLVPFTNLAMNCTCQKSFTWSNFTHHSDIAWSEYIHITRFCHNRRITEDWFVILAASWLSLPISIKIHPRILQKCVGSTLSCKRWEWNDRQVPTNWPAQNHPKKKSKLKNTTRPGGIVSFSSSTANSFFGHGSQSVDRGMTLWKIWGKHWLNKSIASLEKNGSFDFFWVLELDQSWIRHPLHQKKPRHVAFFAGPSAVVMRCQLQDETGWNQMESWGQNLGAKLGGKTRQNAAQNTTKPLFSHCL